METSPDSCKIETKLDEIHRWAHDCLHALNHSDLHAAHALGEKILRLLDDEPCCNGIKFIAVLEALTVGVSMLEEEMRRTKHLVYLN